MTKLRNGKTFQFVSTQVEPQEENTTETSIVTTRSMKNNNGKRVVSELSQYEPPYKRAPERKVHPKAQFKFIRQSIHFIPQPENGVDEKHCECADEGWNCNDDRCTNRIQSTDCPKSCRVENCGNQRFQKPEGEDPRFEVFDTKTVKGKGVRACEKIGNPSFIAEFMGEFITKKKEQQRREEYKRNGFEMEYFMDVGKFTIDPTLRGNKMRFLNHSCDPNCVAKKWTVPREDEKAPRVYMESVKVIEVGEELTFDYGPKYVSSVKYCYCGASNCRNPPKDE